MAKASVYLTPVTLELGGKSPVIVDETADLKLAARRIAFGKVLNAGQTCVEPDYLLIQRSVKDAFVDAYRQALQEFFPDGNMDEMPVIVSEKHFARVKHLLEGQNAVLGGQTDAASRFVTPTLLDDVSPDSPVMQEEIFGPILPMLCYDRLDEAIAFIRRREKPLALYLFTSDRQTERRVLDSCSFGGGCINDTFFFNDTATTQIYTLSLHDALPIYPMSDSEKYAASPRHSCSSEGSLPAFRDGRLISAGREISLNGTAASPIVSRASVLKLPSAACTSEAPEKVCTSSSVNPSVEISR